MEDEIDLLDSIEFYELMQAYRHSRMGRPLEVIEDFRAVQNYIRENFTPKNGIKED